MPEVAVLRVVNEFPQLQVTLVSTYSGWMSRFMGEAPSQMAAGSCSPRVGGA
ncbi:hypothetical protein GCM10028777_08270 [Angustibacter speluncae]